MLPKKYATSLSISFSLYNRFFFSNKKYSDKFYNGIKNNIFLGERQVSKLDKIKYKTEFNNFFNKNPHSLDDFNQKFKHPMLLSKYKISFANKIYKGIMCHSITHASKNFSGDNNLYIGYDTFGQKMFVNPNQCFFDNADGLIYKSRIPFFDDIIIKYKNEFDKVCVDSTYDLMMYLHYANCKLKNSCYECYLFTQSADGHLILSMIKQAFGC